MGRILYSSDDFPRRLQPGDYALNSSTGKIIQMTEITSAMFGNDNHLVKCIKDGDNIILDGKIVGAILYHN